MLWVCFIFKFEFLFIQVLSLNSQAHSLHKLKKYTNKVEFFVSIILLQPSVWHFWYQKKKKKKRTLIALGHLFGSVSKSNKICIYFCPLKISKNILFILRVGQRLGPSLTSPMAMPTRKHEKQI